MTDVRVPWLFALVVATAFAVGMALMPHPVQIAEVGDKWQHMAAFGTLTLLRFRSDSLLRLGFGFSGSDRLPGANGGAED